MDRPTSQGIAAPELAQMARGMARAEAFKMLSEQHLDASYRIACAILGDRTEAHDGVQDAFVRAWEGWSSLRDPGRFEQWFMRILVNTCRNRLRSRARNRVADISSELDVAQPGDPYAHTNDRQQLELALSTLDPEHRIVVALRYFADMTIDQIASQLSVPSGTVKSRLHHALRRLEASLNEPSARGTDR